MKYCIHFRDEKLPISEDEIPKVLQAMEEKAIVVLRCGVIHGSFISGITRDIHSENGWNYGYKPTGGDGLTRASYVTELPERIGPNYELLPAPDERALPKPYKD